MNKVVVTAIVVIVLVAAASLIVVNRGGGGGGTAVVAVTFPGVADDVRLLLEGCDSVRVETIAPPGVDPHEYNLEPSKVELVRKAVLVVSTGHAPFEARIREIAGDKTVVIPEIPGIMLEKTPSGAVNRHMPIYDPRNYRVFIEYLAGRLGERLPACRETIEANAARLEERAMRLYSMYHGILSGRPAVISGPVAQYAVGWLGVDVRLSLLVEHGSQTTPQQLEEARRILEQGGIAVIVYYGDRPASKAGEWLAQTAGEMGAPVLRVPAPYQPGAIIEKIEYVASQAASLQG